MTPTTKFNIVFACLMIGYLFVLRHEPPSRTIKRAEFLFEGSSDVLLERSLGALRQIGSEPGVYDVNQAIIIAAGKRMGSLNWGTIIVVRVSDAGGNNSRLKIAVDSVNPAMLIDLCGTNARLLRKFKTAML
jgi:hypothetical protein